MPREHIKWSVKQSVQDANRLRAHQSCTYSSIVNVDRSAHPYIKSFEREQTWTLTQSMAKQSKRYQSSIENIHLTMPSMTKPSATRRSSNCNHDQYDFKKIKLDRSMSLLPPLPPTKPFAPYRSPIEPNADVYSKTLSSKSLKNTAIKSMTTASTNPMRIIYLNGEFVVRIWWTLTDLPRRGVPWNSSSSPLLIASERLRSLYMTQDISFGCWSINLLCQCHLNGLEQFSLTERFPFLSFYSLTSKWIELIPASYTERAPFKGFFLAEETCGDAMVDIHKERADLMTCVEALDQINMKLSFIVLWIEDHDADSP